MSHWIPANSILPSIQTLGWLVTLCVIFRKLRAKPSPWATLPRVPILGTLPFVNGPNFPLQCSAWRRKYGQIYSYKPGLAQEILVVCGARLAKELFITNSQSFQHRHRPFFYARELKLEDHFTPLLDSSPAIQTQRRLIYQAIKASITRGKGAAVHRASLGLLQTLRSHVNNPTSPALDLHQVIADAVGLAALSLSYGFDWTTKDLRACKEVAVLFAEVPEYFAFFNWINEPSVAFPFLIRLLGARTQRIRESATQAAQNLLASYQGLFALTMEKVRNEGVGSLDDSVARILLSDDEEDIPVYRQSILCGSAATAAFSTTAGTVHLLVGCLAAYPEWQAKLQVEVDRLAKTQDPLNSSNGLPSFVSDKDHEHACLTWAFIDEVLRYYPIFPINTRVASQDYTLHDGRTIKTGQILFTVPAAINRDPELYDDPDTFDPTRFLNDDLGSAKLEKGMKLNWPKYRHVSFGSGRRSCPGSELAEYSIFVLLVQLVHCFEVRYEDERSHDIGIRPELVGLENHFSIPKIKFIARRDLSHL
ncbi:cytochrome P450 monooxygenase [Melampsora americana]|nr:cytochrome P450 monooxygenase [Melampsora americana]